MEQVAVSSGNNTEFGSSSGVSSSIQTQLNNKANQSSTDKKQGVDALLVQNYPIGDVSGIKLMNDDRKLTRLYCYNGIIGGLIFNPHRDNDLPIGLNVDDTYSSFINYYTKAETYTKLEIDTQFSNLIQSAPATLNTLNKLAQALNNDANYAATVQTQLNAKQATITGGATTITSTNLAINRALISDGSGTIAI